MFLLSVSVVFIERRAHGIPLAVSDGKAAGKSASASISIASSGGIQLVLEVDLKQLHTQLTA